MLASPPLPPSLIQAAVAKRTKGLRLTELPRPRWRWVQDSIPKRKAPLLDEEEDEEDDVDDKAVRVARIAAEGEAACSPLVLASCVWKVAVVLALCSQDSAVR